jgi:flagellar biosynthesis protein
LKKNGKIPLAAVIKYDGKKDAAPRITAKGRGFVAEKIIELARKHDVPIKNDPALVQILSKLEINDHIPEELYRAVAEILAFVYSVNTKWREKEGG